MQDVIKIAVVQGIPQWMNPRASRKHFEALISSLIPYQVDVIIMPEMFTTGFTMEPEEVAEPPNGETLNWMLYWANKLGAVLTASWAVRENNMYFNRLHWVQPDGSVYTYDKRHLFVLTGEEKIYTPGTKRVIVGWKGWTFLLSICFDLRFPYWYWLPHMYDVGIVVASWPLKRIHAWKQLLIARAIENQAYFVGVNRVGSDPYEYYSGDSMVVDFTGNVVVSLANVAETAIVTLKKSKLREFRQKYPFAISGEVWSGH